MAPLRPRTLATFRSPTSRPWRIWRGRAAILGLAIALSAAFLALYLILAERGQRDSIVESRRVVAAVAAGLTDQLSRALETTDLVLLDMASGPAEGGAPWDAGRIGLRLRELPHLRALLVTDSLGRVQFSSVPSLVGTELADRPWLRRITGGGTRLVVGAPEAGRFLGEPGRSVQEARRWTIPLARPLTGPEGSMQGAVLALLNPGYLSAIGQRMAEAFGVTVRFFALDGTLLATSGGGPEGVGLAHPRAWLFRDFLPQLDSGTRQGPDSAGIPAVASFGVAVPGLVAVEISQPMEAVLAPARRRALELGIGIGGVAASTLLTLALVFGFSQAIGRKQEAVQQAELLREAAEREALALRASRAETQRLLGGLPTVTFQAEIAPDRPDRYRYIGGNIEAVTGWPAAELQELAAWRERLAPEGGGFGGFLRRVAEEGTATREDRFRQPDGSWRWLRTVAMLLERRPDGAAEIVGHVSDLTAEREANARMAAAGRLTSLGEMATGLAHELKQPLAILSMAAENLDRALENGRLDSARQRARRIIDQAGRAGQIIEHLRHFARGTPGGLPPEPVALERAVQGALALVGGALRQAAVEVTQALGDPPPTAMGQLVALEQVLVNLLLNACHALERLPPGAPRRITLAAEALSEDGLVRLRVGDSGGGIAPEVLARLFEPFVTTKGPEKGMGLGLSICHGLIRSMGGSITARNAAEGAEFTITLASAPAAAMAG
ncbi:ATP-binding protein [Roseicella aerolata]|uniref:histidine kinase n=1 Tax=Roseicella aerolata TaxID=2883479 RepID=A0A9X1LAL5_9PROT|nr:ATP-binding protein [Roseicella aerolata]MCB4821527.1 hypothetical protein [Roseicella aerolata]